MNSARWCIEFHLQKTAKNTMSRRVRNIFSTPHITRHSVLCEKIKTFIISFLINYLLQN